MPDNADYERGYEDGYEHRLTFPKATMTRNTITADRVGAIQLPCWLRCSNQRSGPSLENDTASRCCLAMRLLA